MVLGGSDLRIGAGFSSATSIHALACVVEHRPVAVSTDVYLLIDLTHCGGQLSMRSASVGWVCASLVSFGSVMPVQTNCLRLLKAVLEL